VKFRGISPTASTYLVENTLWGFKSYCSQVDGDIAFVLLLWRRSQGGGSPEHGTGSRQSGEQRMDPVPARLDVPGTQRSTSAFGY
jgi:hypothetical protein